MHSYGVRDVERILSLPRGAVRGLIGHGFVSPTRGPRREYRFSFRDLIVLRIARALMNARVPQRRITRALKQLRERLPETAPLSGLSIRAVAGQVTVRDGSGQWDTHSGQYLLELDVNVEGGAVKVIERSSPVAKAPADEAGGGATFPPTRSPVDVDEWFERALGMEDLAPSAAIHAYHRCLEVDPDHLGARINCGRLLHEAGQLAEAERLYRDGLRDDGSDPTLLFNLAILLEDVDRRDEAIQTYQSALAIDPEFADAHYNLARLYEARGETQHAIRHLGCYRKLTASGD